MATAVAYYGLVYNQDPARKDVVLKTLYFAMDYCESAFATILGEDAPAGGLSDAYALGRGHHNRLINCWFGGLRDRIAPYAFEVDPDKTGQWPSAMPQ